jgi:hypothetical protein
VSYLVVRIPLVESSILPGSANPGLRSVAVQGHFAPRGNRFYPALLRAGISPEP